MKNKYGNRKVEACGVLFASKREAKRWTELKILEYGGMISELERQVKFVLIPAQYEPDIIGPRGGVRKGKCLERECAYYADFVYKDKEGNMIVEDAKGVRTPEYVMKRKLMLSELGIRIKEV